MTTPGPRTYYATFAALLLLWGAAVAVGALGLGPLAGLSVAAGKAALIAGVFMHLRWSGPLTRLFAAVGLVWLGLLFALSLADLLSRGWSV